MGLTDQLRRLMAPLERRVLLLVGRALVETVKDSTGIQTMQVSILKGEVKDGVERLQNYGFTSRPKKGAEACVLFLGGNRDHGIVIAVDDRRYRLKGLSEGEVALYTDQGDKVHLKRGGTIEVKASSKVILDCPDVEIGRASLEKALAGETFQSYFNDHKHIDSMGGITQPPLEPSLPAHLSSQVKIAKGGGI